MDKKEDDREIMKVMAELRLEVAEIETVLRPIVDQTQEHEAAIIATLRGGAPTVDGRDARRPHYAALADIRISYGKLFTRRREAKAMIKAWDKVLNMSAPKTRSMML